MLAKIVEGTASSIIRYAATGMAVNVVQTEMDKAVRVVDFRAALRVLGLRTSRLFPKHIDRYLPRRMTEYLNENDPHFFEPIIFTDRNRRQIAFDTRGICRVAGAGALSRHIKAKHRTIHEQCKVFAVANMYMPLQTTIDNAALYK